MIQTTSTINNPFTGVFGNGQVQTFNTSGTWTVPAGVGKVRVRLWGAGGSGPSAQCGAGGGFALKSIYDLAGVTTVAVTVAQSALSAGGTSSFGSYVSATGGQLSGASGGIGIGGDINTQGGVGNGTNSQGGGGAASVLGNGGFGSGSGAAGGNGSGGAGGAGGGASAGGNGFLGNGATASTSASSGIQGNTSIDFIGMGGGGYGAVNPGSGINGGGSWSTNPGGFPGGGSSGGIPGAGLVIVEW